MRVYDLLVENGFIVESSLTEYTIQACNGSVFLIDFLNNKGFIILDEQNRQGMGDTIIYEYGCDSYSGRVEISLKKDFTKKLHLKIECQKPEK